MTEIINKNLFLQVKSTHGKASETSPLSTRSKSAAGDAASVGSCFGIRSFVNASVLGQHGGELLADLKYSASFSSISGMIVCGTKVIKFTAMAV